MENEKPCEQCGSTAWTKTLNGVTSCAEGCPAVELCGHNTGDYYNSFDCELPAGHSGDHAYVYVWDNKVDVWENGKHIYRDIVGIAGVWEFRPMKQTDPWTAQAEKEANG